MLEKRVFELVKMVPDGRVTTYREMARALGNQKLARAVGNALNGNRDLKNVPCFKVVRSDGTVGGYVLGVDEKIRRLKKSGVKVKNGRIPALEAVLHKYEHGL